MVAATACSLQRGSPIYSLANPRELFTPAAHQTPFRYVSAPMDRRTDPSPHLVADGVAAFRDPADADRPAAPSLALVARPRPRAPLSADFAARPTFATRPRADGADR